MAACPWPSGTAAPMRSMLDGSDAGKPVIELLHEDGLRPGFYVNAETELNEDVVEFKWVRVCVRVCMGACVFVA